jgi:hypothetical protein
VLWVIVAVALLVSSAPLSAGPLEESVPVAEAQRAPARSIVYVAHDPFAMDHLEAQPEPIGRMVDAIVVAVTKKNDIDTAWRSLVSPKDRVGIKIAANGGRYFSTHRAIVERIAMRLRAIGVSDENIIVWDRDALALRDAGFGTVKGKYKVRSIAPQTGYDREAPVTAPVLGKLIWGDLLFRERAPSRLRGLRERVEAGADADQLSATSHIARLLSTEITKVINVPLLCDEPNCGVAGALYNMTVPNVDNWRRFSQAEGAGSEAIPSVYADEHIGPKVVLHIMDGLTAQYAAGPIGNPNYAFAHCTLYASNDPVALDATALRALEGWRKEAKLPPIGSKAEWLRLAEELGLGQFGEQSIVLQTVNFTK